MSEQSPEGDRDEARELLAVKPATGPDTPVGVKVVAVVLLGGLAIFAAVKGFPDPRRWAEGDTIGVAALWGVYVVASLVPVPKAPFSIACGALLGVAVGLPVALTAATAGAVVAFVLARFVGRETVRRRLGARLEQLDELMAARGVVAVIGLRLVPLVPFTLLNYASGVTGVRLSAYVVGTLVGMLPGTAAYVVLGALGRHPGSWPLGVVLVALLAFIVATVWVVSRRRAGGDGAARPPTPT